MGRRQELEKRQTLLSRFGRLVAAESRLDGLLTIIAEEVRHILAADRCSVFLVDPYKGELWTKVSVGANEKVLRIPMGQGIAGFVAKTGSAVNIRDAYRDTRFTQDLDRVTGYQTRSVLAVPLRGRDGKAVGVFEVLNKGKGAFTDEDEGLLRILATMAASFIENASLYEDLRRSHLETIYRMALVAEFRDQKDTGRHLRRMSRFSGILARSLGMSYQEAEDIRYASPLHDVGKVAIPDSILRKPGKLTAEEYEEMKRHTIYGSQMLSNAESRLLRLAGKIAIAHHEHFDGSGYPYHLKGEAIPIEARIVSVADVFDALVSKRVYKGAWTVEDALKYIRNEEGKLFDPRVSDCLGKSFDEVLAAMEEENRRFLEEEAGMSSLPGAVRAAERR
ncbi:MAG: GAF domain-containing protein [Elusimicrobia bacterium]|nr:GAF domain-containing protein [Elusimicrobiota bacterium]MDE2425156.1 GAF domain-containing protein [Elusimicrobiota bacterium]